MAVRTTQAAVREVLEISDGTVDLTRFIAISNSLVTEHCTAGDLNSDDRLEMIECLLAAHLYCLKEMRAKTEKAGSVSEQKDTILDLYFAHTHHGQMALMLDSTGGLLALQKKAKDPNNIRQAIGASYLGMDDQDEVNELITD